MRPFKKKPDQNNPRRESKGNYAFIDSQNLNLGVQKMGWKMDWKKFREWLKSEYNVEKAFMFIGYMPDFESLYDQLHAQGYLVVLKPTIEMYATPESNEAREKSQEAAALKDGKPEEKHKPKGNVDTDLVLHVMKEFKNYDKALIVSGDGDFYTLIEYLDQQNKLLKILTPNWQFSTLLKDYEKYIVRLDQKRNELRYHDRFKSKGSGPRGKK
jgi:uncharacterized LabA/DUF88 family protein